MVAPVLIAGLTTHVKVIDGIRYESKAWPTIPALTHAAELIRVFGDIAMMTIALGMEGKWPQKQPVKPPVAPDPAAPPAPPAAPERDASALLLLLASAAKKGATSEEASALIKECFRDVTADKVKIGEALIPESVYNHFDLHFLGRYDHLGDVLAWVISTSFFLPAGASH